MRLHCEFSTPISRCDVDDYVLPEYEEWVLKEWEEFKDVAED